MLNAGRKGVNVAISNRKHISATVDEGAASCAGGGGHKRREDGCLGYVLQSTRSTNLFPLYDYKLWWG